MDLMKQFFEKARAGAARIVYPEGQDARIVMAASKAADMGIAAPIILGDKENIDKLARENGVSTDKIDIVSPRNRETLARYTDIYADSRNIRSAVAAKLVRKPLLFGGMMVKTGEADGMVAGVASATASVIQAAALTIGFQKGLSTPSSLFVMVIPDLFGEKNKPLVFADCAVTIAPNARQLAEIAVASGHNAQALLGIEPKVAFLSFSTKGSANHDDVDKVVEALRMAREMAPDMSLEGELQGDAAVAPAVAEKKAPGSAVAGHANVLIFPDLDAGNICYKLVQYLANAKAFGPILQGFAKPVNDMSRGATVDDLLGVTAITSAQAAGNGSERL